MGGSHGTSLWRIPDPNLNHWVRDVLPQLEARSCRTTRSDLVGPSQPPRQLSKLVEQLEHLLTYVPRNQGESRYSTVRVMFLDMLIVTFDVIEDDKRVDILDIRNKPQ